MDSLHSAIVIVVFSFSSSTSGSSTKLPPSNALHKVERFSLPSRSSTPRPASPSILVKKSPRSSSSQTSWCLRSAASDLETRSHAILPSLSMEHIGIDQRS